MKRIILRIVELIERVVLGKKTEPLVGATISEEEGLRIYWFREIEDAAPNRKQEDLLQIALITLTAMAVIISAHSSIMGFPAIIIAGLLGYQSSKVGSHEEDLNNYAVKVAVRNFGRQSLIENRVYNLLDEQRKWDYSGKRDIPFPNFRQLHILKLVLKEMAFLNSHLRATEYFPEV